MPQPAAAPKDAAEGGSPAAPGANGFDVALLLAALVGRVAAIEPGAPAAAGPPAAPAAPGASAAPATPGASAPPGASVPSVASLPSDAQSDDAAAALAGSALAAAAVAPAPAAPPTAATAAPPSPAAGGAVQKTAAPAQIGAPPSVPATSGKIAAAATDGVEPAADGTRKTEPAAPASPPAGASVAPGEPANAPIPATATAPPPAETPGPVSPAASEQQFVAAAEGVAVAAAPTDGTAKAPPRKAPATDDPTPEPVASHARPDAHPHGASHQGETTVERPVPVPDATAHDARDAREPAQRPTGDAPPHALATNDGPTPASPVEARDAARAPRASEPPAPESPAPRTPDAVHQVERLVRLDELRPRPLHDGGDMRLELSPEGLGRIEVHVSVRDDGVQANLLAQHDHAREVLELHRPALEAALGRSSLRLDGFTVGLGERRQDDAGATPQERRAPAAAPRAGETTAAPLPGASREGGLSLRA